MVFLIASEELPVYKKPDTKSDIIVYAKKNYTLGIISNPVAEAGWQRVEVFTVEQIHIGFIWMDDAVLVSMGQQIAQEYLPWPEFALNTEDAAKVSNFLNWLARLIIINPNNTIEIREK